MVARVCRRDLRNRGYSMYVKMVGGRRGGGGKSAGHGRAGVEGLEGNGGLAW